MSTAMGTRPARPAKGTGELKYKLMGTPLMDSSK
uniref:Uncharacterized protein n=1 Tax=Arundo donax TaxID=35708 RepID=A0A0A8XR48_ARUDO